VKRIGILILSLMLTGSLVPAAHAQRGQKPPQHDNRGGDKKNPPGPIVREEKRGDGNRGGGNRGGGNKRGGEKPPKPPRP
jgi:hypothetical protein